MKKEILELKEQLERDVLSLSKQSATLSNIRGFLFLCMLVFAGMSYQSSFSAVFLVLLAFFLFLFGYVVYRHYHVEKNKCYSQNCLLIIEEYVARVDGSWQKEREEISALLEEIEDLPDFVNDFHIASEHSLFHFLNRAVSIGGKRRLLRGLCLLEIEEQCDLNPSPKASQANAKALEKIGQTQRAISWLSEHFSFCLDFQANLKSLYQMEKTDFKESFPLFEYEIKISVFELMISGLLSIMSISGLLLGALGYIEFIYFEVLFLIQMAIAYYYAKKYRVQMNAVSGCALVFGRLKPLYKFLNGTFENLENEKREDVNSEKVLEKTLEKDTKKDLEKSLEMELKTGTQSDLILDLMKCIKSGNHILNKIAGLDAWNSMTKNIISHLFGNVFLSLNVLVLYKYKKLLEEDAQVFKQSISAIEEFEKLISLATIAFVKEKICMPDLTGDMHLAFQEIRYPLMDEERCIGNDFETGLGVNLITGSNMSGKTSFMRAIGTNLVLAYCGSFVNAKSFRAPLMKLFTSINVKDDISKGISTFYGELLRIQKVLEYGEKSSFPMIVFIDEIFKGTNYQDRIKGAKSALKKLLELNCMVFLTTHDFELCEMKEEGIKNYHFYEKYEDGKMVFHHKIKSGKSTSTNAEELMRQVGIL